MEIKLSKTSSVDIEIGSYVYDELTDTWISWDMLDPATQDHLKILVRDIEASTTAIRAATFNSVTTLITPSRVS